MNPQEISDLLKRICEQEGIPFSHNRVLPGLADLKTGEREPKILEQLVASGNSFGIRFRSVHGQERDLLNMLRRNQPVLLCEPGDDADGTEKFVLILEATRRGRLKVWFEGRDRIVSIRWIRQNFPVPRGKPRQWYLAQTLLSADQASNFDMFSSGKNETLTPFRRWVGLLKPEGEDIRSILIFSIIVGLLSLTTPLAVEAVVNTIAFGRYLQPLIVLSLIVFVFLAFRASLNVLMTVIGEFIQRKLFVRTVEDLAYRLTRVPLATWQTKHGPELVNRFFDIVNVQKITSKLLLESLMLFLQTLIGLSVLAFYHPFLLGYDLGLLAMMSIILYLIGRGAIHTARHESQLKYETAAWLQEVVRHPATFKYNGGLGYAINRADELTAKYIQSRQDHFSILIRQISFSAIMQAVAATTLLALGGYLVIVGQMTLGQLVAAELIVTVILGSFAKLGKDLESFYDLMASVDKLGKLFDLPTEPVYKLQLPKTPGAYSLSLVNLQLGSNDVPSSIKLEAGKSFAIHGSSELKRSRLLEAMVGQRNAAAGHVLLDRYRVDTLSAESLQAKVSIVRDIELFDGTVDENIRMGRENVGSDQVSDIIEQLGLQGVVSTLKDGLLTRLNVSGYPLTQGDAIRLVLARSLVSKPGVMFVDGLIDRLSDTDILDLLERLEAFREHTTIVISTGRRAIAEWADQNLNMDTANWELVSFNG